MVSVYVLAIILHVCTSVHQNCNTLTYRGKFTIRETMFQPVPTYRLTHIAN